MDIEFLRFTINWNKTKREFVKEILDRNKEKNIMIFKNRKQLNKWYEKEFSEKMEI